MDIILEQFILFVISLFANGLSALAGGGAGLLQLPALLFLGLAFGTALATHKIASVALGVGATVRHIREKGIDLRFSLFILIAGLPGVVLGALVILAVPDVIARLVLGFFTTGLGLYSWEGGFLGFQMPNVQFKQFEEALSQGWHVFFVDVNERQLPVLQGVTGRHRGLKPAGIGSSTPHWLIGWQNQFQRFIRWAP